MLRWTAPVKNMARTITRRQRVPRHPAEPGREDYPAVRVGELRREGLRRSGNLQHRALPEQPPRVRLRDALLPGKPTRPARAVDHADAFCCSGCRICGWPRTPRCRCGRRTSCLAWKRCRWYSPEPAVGLMAAGHAPGKDRWLTMCGALPAPNPVLLRPIGKHQSIRQARQRCAQAKVSTLPCRSRPVRFDVRDQNRIPLPPKRRPPSLRITRKTAIHENMSHGARLLYRCHALPGKRAHIDGSGLDARRPEFFIYFDNSG